MQKAYMEWASIADMWMGFDLVSDSGGHRSGVRIVANDWQTDLSQSLVYFPHRPGGNGGWCETGNGTNGLAPKHKMTTRGVWICRWEAKRGCEA
jgi:hypothetical protein